jgi:uncharacterized transporter YbjL
MIRLQNLNSLPSSNMMGPITTGARLSGSITRTAGLGAASEISEENLMILLGTSKRGYDNNKKT